jgi:hypothetical protein
MHGGWQLFSSTLLVEVERSQLKMWVALYTLARVQKKGEREKHMLTHSPCLVGPGRAMGAGAQHVCEWSVKIRATTTELVTTKNHKPHLHLRFHLLHCCAAKANSSRSSTCIHDQESKFLKPSSSTILYLKRANKVFGKRSL